MKTFSTALALALLAPALGAYATAATAKHTTHTGTALVATLDGKAEVPGPGDPNGNGEFSGWFDPAIGRICYTLGVGSLANPTMAHIHRGAAQVAGPPVVMLANPVHNISDTCQPADAALVREIVANPSGFYVNVHSTEHPSGAIRAQLRKP
ncbi:MAG TPA: CHRD domain-containing protein [Croceibacterium sp.]|nr:CHRD domain-containing protein [Croceibacterium sp.]